MVTVHDKRKCQHLCWSHAKKRESQSFSLGHSKDCQHYVPERDPFE